MPSDKERLDWIEKSAKEATRGAWFSVNYDGLIIMENGAGDKDDFAESSPNLRRAIDAAIKASKRGGRDK